MKQSQKDIIRNDTALDYYGKRYNQLCDVRKGIVDRYIKIHHPGIDNHKKECLVNKQATKR